MLVVPVLCNNGVKVGEGNVGVGGRGARRRSSGSPFVVVDDTSGVKVGDARVGVGGSAKVVSNDDVASPSSSSP